MAKKSCIREIPTLLTFADIRLYAAAKWLFSHKKGRGVWGWGEGQGGGWGGDDK